MFSAEMFSAEMFSAEMFSAEMFSAEMFSADGFSADGFSADGFRGLLTVSDEGADGALVPPPTPLKVMPLVFVPSLTTTFTGDVLVAYTSRVVLEYGLIVTVPLLTEPVLE